MKKENNEYKLLCQAAERCAGREILSPRDFDYLAIVIEQATHQHIGVSTLKRLWGYLSSEKERVPHRYTLDTIARYVGYKNYEAFIAGSMLTDNCESDFVTTSALSADCLNEDDRLRIMWKPNRVMTVRCEGDNTFIIEEVTNSKLSVGDCFCCDRFTQGEPLYLYHLIHDNGKPTGYVCGRQDGITFELLHTPENNE